MAANGCALRKAGIFGQGTFLAAFALAGLAACGQSGKSGEFVSDDGREGQYVIDDETGETTASIATEDGTLKLRSGADVPIDLPGGFALYPGARVISNTLVTRELESGGEGSAGTDSGRDGADSGRDGAMVIFESDDSPAQIAQFYRDKALAAGIELQIDAELNAAMVLAGEGADGLIFSLNAAREEDVSAAQLMVSHSGAP